MKGLALDSGEFISADELNARIPHSNPDNWQQYATEREATAQAVIERHRGEIKSLLNLLAKDRGELQALRAQIGQGVPDGWQLVPKEPTDEMVRAALHLDLSYMPGHDGPDRAAVYETMLASAPPAPQQAPLTDEHRQELALTLMAAKLAPSGSVPVHCAAFIALCAAHNIGEKK